MQLNIPAIFDAIVSTLVTYGYFGLFVSSFISALAIPIPAYIVLAGAGALAAQGHFNIFIVLLIALAGNVSADLLDYHLARKYGEQTLRKFGFGRLLDSRVYASIESYLEEFPQSIIYVTRLVTEAGPVVNILAGMSKVPYKTFLFFDILGESSYVLLFGLAGYLLGDAWQNQTNFLFKGLLVLVLLGVFAGVARSLIPKTTN